MRCLLPIFATGLIWSWSNPAMFTNVAEWPIFRWKALTSVPAYHAEALAWYASVSSNATLAQLQAVSDFCTAVDTAGIRGNFLRFNPFLGTNLAASLIPLYRGTSAVHAVGLSADAATAFAEGDYATNTALTGDGTSKYLDTGVSLTNSSVGQNIGFVAFGDFTALSYTNASPIGTADFGVNHYQQVYLGSGVFGGYHGELQGVIFSVPTECALSCRTATNELFGVDSSAAVQTNLNAIATNLVTGSVWVFADNGGGRFWPASLDCYGILKDARPPTLLSIRGAVSNLMSAVGR